MLTSLLTALSQGRQMMKEEDKKELAQIENAKQKTGYYGIKDLENEEFFHMITTPIRYFSYISKALKHN